MISIGHWGCFFVPYPVGFNRMGAKATTWYFTCLLDFEEEVDG